ncbi:unnamed protein product [Phytophthora fragariaefolia]|uniref:Unnamed protein product n=1 Tax=Phytophthora fragariaefolia TaxID=1490495 RepID=A0A9W7D8X3_9STRA|nr:unnamed protein product [Phytophthora fragariaefolia]
MELPDGLMEILGDTDDGDEDLVCLLEKCLHGLKQASRVRNETIDHHLKSMGFKPTKTDPCLYTRDDNDQRCVVCLYVDDMLIAARDQDVIISVKEQIAEKFKIKELGQARYILELKLITIWKTRHWEFASGPTPRLLTRSSDKNMQIPA